LNLCALWHGDLVHLRRRIKKFIERNYVNSENVAEKYTVQLTNPMLYDRLHTLSVEYSLSVDFLVNAAVEHLIDDVDFVRKLRTGK